MKKFRRGCISTCNGGTTLSAKICNYPSSPAIYSIVRKIFPTYSVPIQEKNEKVKEKREASKNLHTETQKEEEEF